MGTIRSQVQIKTAVNELENKHTEEIERLKVEHEKARQTASDSHITSLMNSDIVLMQSNNMRMSLERQTLHNAELLKQIQRLNLKLALGQDVSTSFTKDDKATIQSKIVFDLDIEALCINYQRVKSFDAFEEQKNAELIKIRDKVSKYAQATGVHIILFADRYISRFKSFAEQYTSPAQESRLIIRLPLFSRREIISFTKHFPVSFKTSIHVPYFVGTESERKLQRLGLYKQFLLPPDETKGADQPIIT